MFFRKYLGIITSAAMAAAAIVTPAHAVEPLSDTKSPFTHEECRAIGTLVKKRIFAKNAKAISDDYKASLMSFVAPNGKPTCDGNMNSKGEIFIYTPTDNDVNAFSLFKVELHGLKRPHPIELQDKKVYGVMTLSTSPKP